MRCRTIGGYDRKFLKREEVINHHDNKKRSDLLKGKVTKSSR